MNPSVNLTKDRKDLSPYLFHFTKGADAYGRLVNILNQLKLVSDAQDIKPFRKGTHFLVAPQKERLRCSSCSFLFVYAPECLVSLDIFS